MNRKSLIAGIILSCSSTAALADQFYIDVGTDFGGNANTAAGATTTGWLNEMTYDYQSTTIVDGPLVAGSSITTTGGFSDLASISTNLITAFNPQQTTFGGPSDNGFGGDWGLTFKFDLVGTLGALGSTNYNSGDVTFFYYDNTMAAVGDFVELFTIDILSTFNSLGGPVLGGMVTSVSGDTLGSGVAAADVFNFADGTFGSLLGDLVDVFASVDYNTDFSQVTQVDNGDGTWTLTGLHNGSISFQIPEPSSLAVLGLGLLGLAGAGRRRKN